MEWMESNTPPKLGCEKCNSEDGFLKKPREPLGFELTLCDCRILRERINEMIWKQKNAGIWKRMSKERYPFGGYEFNHIEFEKMREIVLQGAWVFLTGGAGTGKTYTAVILAKIAIAFEKTVLFENVASALDGLRPSADEQKRAEFKKRLINTEVLVLDDIGHEKASEWVREQLYLIVNQRWQSKRQTIFTSNFPLEDLKIRISSAVYSRVKGESLEINFDSDGKDRRLT